MKFFVSFFVFETSEKFSFDFSSKSKFPEFKETIKKVFFNSLIISLTISKSNVKLLLLTLQMMLIKSQMKIKIRI